MNRCRGATARACPGAVLGGALGFVLLLQHSASLAGAGSESDLAQCFDLTRKITVCSRRSETVEGYVEYWFEDRRSKKVFVMDCENARWKSIANIDRRTRERLELQDDGDWRGLSAKSVASRRVHATACTDVLRSATRSGPDATPRSVAGGERNPSPVIDTSGSGARVETETE
jgi:hypothetical protein